MKMQENTNESFDNKTFYKYRSLTNFENFVDIIVYKRLYAAKYQELNDPMEGLFYYNSNKYGRETIDNLKTGKTALFICSLSKSPNIGLLWSHYADSCKGVVIELEVLENTKPEKVTYDSNSITINEETTAKDILKMKLSAWSYEKEYRVLTYDQHVSIKIKSVILGSKMKDNMKKLVSDLVSAIDENITVRSANNENIDYSSRS